MKKFLLASVAALAFSTPSLAADFAPVPQFSWTGIYVGGAVGYGWPKDVGKLNCDSITITGVGGSGANENADKTDCTRWTKDYGFEVFQGEVVEGPKKGNTYPAFEFPSGDYISLQGTDREEDGGIVGGVMLGGNLQYGGFVFGFEGDFSWSGVKATSVSEFGHFGHDSETGADQTGNSELNQFIGEGRINVQDDLDWLSTVRLRAGHVFGEEGRVMIFGTVGLAGAQVSRSASTFYDQPLPTPGGKCDEESPSECEFVGLRFKDRFYQGGYVLGGGVSWAVTDNVIVGAEYLYTDFLSSGSEVSAKFEGDNRDKKMDINIADDGFDSVQQARVRVVFKY